MVTPSAWRLLSRPNNACMPLGESTAVGSSRISTLASALNSRARAISTPALLGLDRQISNTITQANAHAEIFQMSRSNAPPDRAGRRQVAPRSAPELHCFSDGEGRRQRKTLMDHNSTPAARAWLTLPVGISRPPIANAPDRRLDDSGHDASEGRLAGAILAYHRMDQVWRESATLTATSAVTSP